MEPIRLTQQDNGTDTYLGIDGCKSGWCVWCLSDGVLSFDVFPTLNALFASFDKPVHCLIDMPIGFSDAVTPDRLCDKAARKRLTKVRQSSVFPVPCKAAVYSQDYATACKVNLEQLGKKFSKQTWGIVPKIRELNDFLELDSQHVIRESHPEVLFTVLAGEPLRHSKRSKEGLAQRIVLLEALSPALKEALEHAFRSTMKKVAMPDDIVDALVLCIVSQSQRRLTRFPTCVDYDADGRCREIVYPTEFLVPTIQHIKIAGVCYPLS
ncbi:DUF429 domain-containing protein [Vibrio agarivorans]|uniref:DUF429 domain-containing protein n=1 Tax=Vibrio agarivorans TaxID=153622 RepID=UPI0025B5B221|nr:DUF429 domain-containing protein [Vibrio agarivorans]MDN3663726.1 DUF429 domain-containing protein [Vibrio agarivorans]